MDDDGFDSLWNKYCSALMAKDINSVLDCYTDDITYDESPMLMESPREGKEQCGEYWGKVFDAFSEIAISTTSVYFANDRAWIEWTMKNLHRATRTQIEIRGALVVTVCDGRISHEKLYWDASKLFRELGAWDKLAKMGIALNVLIKRIVR